MKTEAIVYSSMTGTSAEYANLLSEKTGLPVYELKEALKKIDKKAPVLYISWLMAGRLTDYKKAAQKLHIKGCCAACLNPMERQAEITKNATDIPEDVPLFMLPGAYHPQKLRGMYKWMMKLVTKILVKKISANENKGEAEEKMLSVLSDGGSFVQPEHLTQVIKWLQAE